MLTNAYIINTKFPQRDKSLSAPFQRLNKVYKSQQCKIESHSVPILLSIHNPNKTMPILTITSNVAPKDLDTFVKTLSATFSQNIGKPEEVLTFPWAI